MENIVMIITDCLREDFYNNMKVKQLSLKNVDNVYTTAPSTFFAVPSLLTGTIPFQIIKNAHISKDIFTYLPLISSIVGNYNIFITGNVVTSRIYGYYVPEGFFEDFLKKRNIPEKRIYGMRELALVKHIKDIIKKKSALYDFLRRNKILLRLRHFVNKKRILSNPLWRVNVDYNSKIRVTDIINVLRNFPYKNRKGGYFMYIHLMETHAPYGAPTLSQRMLRRGEKLMKKLYAAPELLKPSEVEAIKELYQSEVEYLDVSLNQLIDFIDRKLGLENTLVIVMSDHGEAFGEEGIFTHPDNALIEPILHVPLAFFGEPAKRIRIEGEGVLPSWKVHELIVKMLFGQEDIIIKREKSMIAIGYRKISNESNKPVYALTNTAIISREGIKTLDLSNPENRQLVENILQMKRREYLKQKLANRVYGFKIGDFFKGGNID